MEPQIRFCTSADGTRIAYATMGEGPPPLVFVPNWFSPFKSMAHEPRVASSYQNLAADRQFVLYDRRGTGMSDRDVPDFRREALVKDLEAVIDHLKLRRVALYALDMAGPVAIEYAHRHPKKVSHLILTGCYVRGQDLVGQEAIEGMLGIIRSGWDMAAKMWPALIMPEADAEGAQRLTAALRESCSADAAADQLEAAVAEDLASLLPQIKTPTLVLHARRDQIVPFEQGSRLASLMPNARLVTLDWEAHWDPRNTAPLLEAINEFLAPRKPAKRKPLKAAPPSGLVTILFTDVEGSTAMTQRLGDAKARDLLREHERMVREALKAHGGSEVKTMGDGFMASFSSATKALESAIAMQRAFAEHNESADEPIKVRIGLNAGEPIAEDDDLFGTAVNEAARITAAAKGGEILASDVVRQLVKGKDFLFADRGEASLKGFDEPVRLYEVRWRE